MKTLTFGELDFATLERIFGVNLFGLDEKETRDILDELSDLWEKLTIKDKITLLNN